MAAKLVNLTVDEWLSCCGSTEFAAEMAKVGPFDTLEQAIEVSRAVWWSKVGILGWLEAFAAHPRIGDLDALREQSTPEVCAGEQSEALKTASEQNLKNLAVWNRQYERKFGFRFLICAMGKSSSEILAVLKARFMNRPIVEFQVAASEQQKITELRLKKKLQDDAISVRGQQNPQMLDTSSSPSEASPLDSASQSADAPKGPRSCQRTLKRNPHCMSKGYATVDRRLLQIEAHLNGACADPSEQQAVAIPEQPFQVMRTRPPITTHVLDVSLGRPGSGIHVSLDWWKQSSSTSTLSLKEWENGEWTTLGTSVTDDDGRSGPLLPHSNTIAAGRYKLTFYTEPYFVRVLRARSDGLKAFYPFVSVVFEVDPNQAMEHFHVPLLLSPFSYSTYRGS